MGPESRILLYERILPDPPFTHVAGSDLTMMNLASKERTQDDWNELLSSVGLVIVKIWRSNESPDLTVIECTKQMSSGQSCL